MTIKLHPDGPPDPADAWLDRAVAELRDLPIPPGPSPMARARTLAKLSALSAASLSSPPVASPAARQRPMRILTALRWPAAAAVLLGAGLAGAYLATGRRPGAGHSLASSGGAPLRAIPALTTPPAHDPARVANSHGSMVTGEIRFVGNPPAPRLVSFDSNCNCAPGRRPVYDDSLVVNSDDTLRNVVVSIVAGLPAGAHYRAPSAPVYLDQEDCSYEPHVLALMTGQTVVLRNSDPWLHTTRSLAVHNPDFNVAQPTTDAGSVVPAPLAPEFFKVRCDVHPWMSSWFCVFNHPFFDVSLANGTFTLRGLPPGHYLLRAWQEKLGTRDKEIVVAAGRDETVNFVFSMPASTPKGAAADVPPAPALNVGPALNAESDAGALASAVDSASPLP